LSSCYIDAGNRPLQGHELIGHAAGGQVAADCLSCCRRGA
jgi:hypothetical protein